MGYTILPRDRLSYQARDLLLPLVEPEGLTPPSGTLNEQLLAYLVRWYLSVPNPTPQEQRDFHYGVWSWFNPSSEPREVIAAVAPLIASRSLTHHVSGLAAALNEGSVEALNTVLDELPTLRTNPRYTMLTDAIGMPRGKQDVTWFPVLRRLIAMHTDAPGLDNAAYGALAVIHEQSKDALPLIVQLLDSKDPNLPKTIAAYLGYYTMFLGPNGEKRDSGVLGPFSTPETRSFTGKGSSLTSAQAAEFWKAWWAENHGKIGYPEP